MICQHCGAEVPDGDNFCTYCGANLAGTPVVYRSNKLNISMLLENTFELYKRHFGTMCFIGLILVIFVAAVWLLVSVMQFANMIAIQFGNPLPRRLLFCGSLCLQFFLGLVQWYLSIGIIQQTLYLTRGGSGIRTDLFFPPFMMFLKFAGFVFLVTCISQAIMLPVMILYVMFMAKYVATQVVDTTLLGIMICTGIPCICISIWLNIRLALAPIFIVDGGTGIADAIRYSWRVSSGNFWRMFIAYIILMIGQLLGFLLCCVGIVTTVAVFGLGCCLIYLQLTGQPNCLAFFPNPSCPSIPDEVPPS